MKSQLLFIKFLLVTSFIYSQGYNLKFINESESNKRVKIFDNYKDLVLSVEDTLISLKKRGNLEAEVKSFIMVDSLNYEVQINKNQKIKYVKISNLSDLDNDVLNILNVYKLENGLVKFEEIDEILSEISKKLSRKGFPFATLAFKNHDLITSSTLESDLLIDYGDKRFLDKVVVKGYEDFPKNFKKNIFKLKKDKLLDLEQALDKSKLINRTKFARNSRDPEILFTKDSTSLFLYLEKIRKNSFDGFISFDTDENSGKINIQGYAKISLNNTFNAGENINFDFNALKNRDRSLKSNINIPYFLGSAFNVNYTLNLIQKDSTYTSNENIIDIDVNLNKTNLGFGFQKNKSDSGIETENIKSFDSKLFNVFSEYLIIDEGDKFNPEFFKLSLRYGLGKKEQLNNITSISKYKLEISKKFNISKRFKFQPLIIKEKINSKNLVNNELLRFGGGNSIRGFDDNSIFSDSYTLLKTNLNYYLNDTIYIYTIFDIANYTDNILNIEKDIYSGGFGFSTLTENGLISVNYSKGNNWGNSFNLKNAKINVIFLTFFWLATG